MATEKTSRKSERVYLDGKEIALNADGDYISGEAESPMEAVGFRYSIIPSREVKDGKVREFNEEFTLDVLLSDLPEGAVNGLACFGGLVLAGNVTNTVRNAKGDSAPRYATQQEALEAWITGLREGNWTTGRGEFEAGIPLLAEAYNRVYRDAKGVDLDLSETIEKLKVKTKDERSSIRKRMDITAAISTIRAEKDAARLKQAQPAEALAEL
jgi:hypothetical protein